jgi:chaperonin cofactor prefoldin
MSTPSGDAELQAQATKRREFEALRTKIEGEAARQRQWQTQLLENGMVLKELETAGEDGKIYKLMGGVLIKQEQIEAVRRGRRRRCSS